ncbi:hypothetical protein ES703_99074 [subsurface metagenome]
MDLSIGKVASATGAGFLPVFQQGLSPIVSPSREGDSACNRGQHPAIKEIVR